MIFIPQNVRENSKTLTILNQSHSNARYRRFKGYTGIHHGQNSTANRRHGRRAVGFSYFRDHPHGIGKIFLGWQNGCQGTGSQLTMTNLTTAWRTQTTGLAHTVGRKSIVQVKIVPRLTIQTLDNLLIPSRTQGNSS